MKKASEITGFQKLFLIWVTTMNLRTILPKELCFVYLHNFVWGSESESKVKSGKIRSNH